MENKAYNLFQMTMNNLQKVLRSATEGDEDALASLKLDNVQPIDFTKVKELTVNNINLTYQTVAKIRSAAQVLRRESINQTARYLMEALHFMQDSIFKKQVMYDIRGRPTRCQDSSKTFVRSALTVGRRKKQVSILET